MAVCFEKAPGGLVKREDWTSRMTYNRGKLLGRMHALTRDYLPRSEKVKRYAWHEEDDFTNYRDYLSDEDAIMADRFAEVQAQIRSIPTVDDSYGLIHMDAHHGNIFFDGDNPTLFDFDDCAYDFFVSDIAISLFYSVLRYPEETREEYARDFLNTFLEGYRTEYTLHNRWRDVIPLILERRHLVLYVAIHRGFDTDNFDQWCRNYIDACREQIEKGIPYLDLDWSQFDLSGQ